MTDEDRNLLGSLGDRFAMHFRNIFGHYPLIMHRECYECFGQRVQINEKLGKITEAMDRLHEALTNRQDGHSAAWKFKDECESILGMFWGKK